MLALFLGLYAVLFATVAVALVMREREEALEAPAAAPLDRVSVVLTEFTVVPAVIRIPPSGAVLRVANRGIAPHNLTVEGVDLATPTLPPGGSTEVSAASLPAGRYRFSCTVPGHAAAGMVGEMVIGASAGAPAPA